VAHPRLAPAVQTLQALHQKLDIANAAGRQLHIQAARATASRGHLFTDPLAGLRNRFHGAEIQRAFINQRLHEFQQRIAWLRLPCRHAALDEHLLFPIARPVQVVSARALFGDADLAQRPIRPEPQIHAITLALGRVTR
jgi:hypothetical protein